MVVFNLVVREGREGNIKGREGKEGKGRVVFNLVVRAIGIFNLVVLLLGFSLVVYSGEGGYCDQVSFYNYLI